MLKFLLALLAIDGGIASELKPNEFELGVYRDAKALHRYAIDPSLAARIAVIDDMNGRHAKIRFAGVNVFVSQVSGCKSAAQSISDLKRRPPRATLSVLRTTETKDTVEVAYKRTGDDPEFGFFTCFGTSSGQVVNCSLELGNRDESGINKAANLCKAIKPAAR